MSLLLISTSSPQLACIKLLFNFELGLGLFQDINGEVETKVIKVWSESGARKFCGDSWNAGCTTPDHKSVVSWACEIQLLQLEGALKEVEC